MFSQGRWVKLALPPPLSWLFNGTVHAKFSSPPFLNGWSRWFPFLVQPLWPGGPSEQSPPPPAHFLSFEWTVPLNSSLGPKAGHVLKASQVVCFHVPRRVVQLKRVRRRRVESSDLGFVGFSSGCSPATRYICHFPASAAVFYFCLCVCVVCPVNTVDLTGAVLHRRWMLLENNRRLLYRPGSGWDPACGAGFV